MSNFKYPHLFAPIQLGDRLFRNRIFASPTGYNNMTGDGLFPLGGAAYYERKAIGGAASVATCELIVDGELGKGTPDHVCLDNPRVKNPLCRVAKDISAHGAIATAELQHAGMFANRTLTIEGGGSHGIAYGPVRTDMGDRIVEEMPEEIIERTIEKYVSAAALAKRCGFGMILLHAGHGWMLHQFLSPLTNTRRDKWGGPDIENRARLAVTICDAIKRELGAGFPIEVRISGSECYDGGYGIEGGIAIARQLEGHCDLIHVSAGNHEVEEVFPVTHPSMFLGEGPNVKYAAEIKKHVKTPVATVGALGDPEMMEDIIASGKADVVELARALIADPDLPNKIRTGREDEITKCMRCLSCFSSAYWFGEPYCAVNPTSGRELDAKYDYPKAIHKKKVLVAGGGIGGMQAALTCSSLGHDVVLCEKTDHLGGAITCEKNVPFKKKLGEYLRTQERLIKRSDIEVRLNTEVTPEYAEKEQADVIFAAIGAALVAPPIPGIDLPNVFSWRSAYLEPEKLGGKITVLGAGLVGLELAIYLAMQGKQVSVVEMADSINDGGNIIHAIGLKLELEKYNIEVSLNTKASEITGAGVKCVRDGADVFFSADNVIYATGRRPMREEALALRYCAPQFIQLGDCISLGNITDATTAAYTAAKNIGRL